MIYVEDLNAQINHTVFQLKVFLFCYLYIMLQWGEKVRMVNWYRFKWCSFLICIPHTGTHTFSWRHAPHTRCLVWLSVSVCWLASLQRNTQTNPLIIPLTHTLTFWHTHMHNLSVALKRHTKELLPLRTTISKGIIHFRSLLYLHFLCKKTDNN